MSGAPAGGEGRSCCRWERRLWWNHTGWNTGEYFVGARGKDILNSGKEGGHSLPEGEERNICRCCCEG